jgi:hypothetical protein
VEPRDQKLSVGKIEGYHLSWVWQHISVIPATIRGVGGGGRIPVHGQALQESMKYYLKSKLRGKRTGSTAQVVEW